MPNQRQAQHKGDEQPHGALAGERLLLHVRDSHGFKLGFHIFRRLFLGGCGRATGAFGKHPDMFEGAPGIVCRFCNISAHHNGKQMKKPPTGFNLWEAGLQGLISSKVPALLPCTSGK